MNRESHSVFVYQYRDAGNYKVPSMLLLRGPHDASVEKRLRGCCDSQEFFVAEQIGVPTLYAELYKYSDGPTADDLAFHEFIGLRPAMDNEISALSLWGNLEELVRRFQDVRYWDCTLSPHCW